MNLTPEEMQWLRLSEKRQRQWRFTRWLCLSIAGSSFGLSGLIFYQLLGPLRAEANRDPAALAWVTPLAYVFFVHGCMWLGLVISKWGGDCGSRLLLRLVAEHGNTGPEPGAAPNGGPTALLGNSVVTGGPPSVS